MDQEKHHGHTGVSAAPARDWSGACPAGGQGENCHPSRGLWGGLFKTQTRSRQAVLKPRRGLPCFRMTSQLLTAGLPCPRPTPHPSLACSAPLMLPPSLFQSQDLETHWCQGCPRGLVHFLQTAHFNLQLSHAPACWFTIHSAHPPSLLHLQAAAGSKHVSSE